MRPVLVALGLLLALPAALRAEAIRSFTTQIHLEGGDVFQVVEKIRYDFGSERRRGIFRDIPVRYGRGRSADYRIDVEVESVTDENGVGRPYRVSRSGRHLRIRIGDPDVYRTGVNEYRIQYRVERGILYLEEWDELYWNATGNEWPVPIEASRAVVHLPERTPLGEVRFACFTGPQGSPASDCVQRVTLGVVSFESERRLAPKEGLTLVVGLPKGVLQEPSAWQRLAARLSDWISVWLLLPALTFAGMLHLWRTRGRDRGASDAVAVRYEPPEGLTPAEMGTVMDESADLADVTATILDLAIRGYLEIEEVESEKFLFLSDRDYILRKKREPADLRRHEVLLMSRLFEAGDRVELSDLKNSFYEHLPAIQEALYEAVSRGGRYFPAAPHKVRRNWAIGGGAVGALGALVLFSTGLPFAPAAAFAAAGAVVLAFARAMPRRTRRGRAVYEEIMGFKEFVERVDADRLERTGGRSAERFEGVLPYAIVLGVADAWADAFAGIYTHPPEWYRSARYSDGFHPQGFVSDVGRSLGALGQTMSSRPRSSGSGSSGFGGGGFSGGGFGGGGGGSW